MAFSLLPLLLSLLDQQMQLKDRNQVCSRNHHLETTYNLGNFLAFKFWAYQV
jgi:hypothetical protein